MAKKIHGGMKAKRITGDVITYIFLIAISIIWLIPFVWLVAQSFRDGKGQFISTFFPTAYTFNNYKALFTEFDVMNFPRMFLNNFNVIYLLTRGEPMYVGNSAGETDLLVTWLYKLSVDQQKYNLAAVIGIFTFVVLSVVSLITYRSSGSYKDEEGFK